MKTSSFIGAGRFTAVMERWIFSRRPRTTALLGYQPIKPLLAWSLLSDLGAYPRREMIPPSGRNYSIAAVFGNANTTLILILNRISRLSFKTSLLSSLQ
jgi:hypothetical protein